MIQQNSRGWSREGPPAGDNAGMKACITSLALAVLLPWVVAGVAGGQGVPQEAVPVRLEPMHHLVLENADVRAYDVIVPVERATLFHVHALDYFYVVLGDAALRSETQGQAPTGLPVQRGQVRFTPGPITHRVVNTGATPFHNVTVELLRPASGSSAQLPALRAGSPQAIVLENERLRATRVVLEPGTATPALALTARTLVIPVVRGTARIDVAGEGPRTVDLEAGAVTWYPNAVTQAITNVGRSPIELIFAELK